MCLVLASFAPLYHPGMTSHVYIRVRSKSLKIMKKLGGSDAAVNALSIVISQLKKKKKKKTERIFHSDGIFFYQKWKFIVWRSTSVIRSNV